MIYKIVHRTTYKYKYPVSVGNHVSCLKPRSMLHHQLADSELRIQPPPVTRTERVDYFGNLLCFFTVQEPHKELVVEARSEVILDGSATPWPQQSLAWEEAAESLPTITLPRDSRLTSLYLSRRAFVFGRSLPPMRSSHLRPGGQCRRRF